MKHLKKFNEEFFFPNPFKKKDSSNIFSNGTPVTPESIKARLSSNRGQSNDKLQIEAEEKFPELVKELDNKLRNTKEHFIEVKQNPTFKTRSTDSVNHILVKMIEDHYEERGFRTDKSYDGRYNCKHDWFRVIVD